MWADDLLNIHRRDLERHGDVAFARGQYNPKDWLIAQQVAEREFTKGWPTLRQRLHVVRAEIIRRYRAGDLQLMICHHLGGPPEKFQPEWWYRPNPESLFYRCSIDPDDPFGRRPNRTTDNVHLIYASCDRVDLIVVTPLPAPLEAEPQSPRPGTVDAVAPEPAGSQPEPTALADLIRRELAAMSPECFVGGCLLQDLIGHLFTVVRPDRGGAPLLGGELLKAISEAIIRAARAGQYTLMGYPTGPSGSMQTLPPETLPSFRFNEWDRSRLIEDGSDVIWYGVTLWRIEVEAPDTEAGEDLGKSIPDPLQGTRSVGKNPDWNWDGVAGVAGVVTESVVTLLKRKKAGEGRYKGDKTFKKDRKFFKQFIQKNVQRIDGSERGTGPDRTTVARAIIAYDLEQYAIFEK
jgi:hypothetical protein